MELWKAIQEFNSNTKTFFKAFDTFIYYITNLDKLAASIWSFITTYSYVTVLIVGSTFIILWVLGWKKGQSIAIGSAVVYMVIVVINSCFGG